MTTMNGQIKNFTSNFGPQHPTRSWCFTINIGNERRSGGTCGTTYWIPPVRHEAADAESAPMPLAMPCLLGPPARWRWPRYPHLRSDEWRTDPGFHERWRVPECLSSGASAYPGVIITTCTSHLGTAERVTRLLSHSTTFVLVIHSLANAAARDNPPIQPAGRMALLAKTVRRKRRGAKRDSAAYTRISFRGRAVSISLRDLRMNAGLGHLEWREPHAGRPDRAIAESLNEVLRFFRRCVLTRGEPEMTKLHMEYGDNNNMS
ncbi:hypothetical protein ACSQ67_023608 [Phaseolus vulgaris]